MENGTIKKTKWSQKANMMWEELKVYQQLDKKEINASFKKFGLKILSELEDYKIDQTSSMIKLYRNVNQLEQAVFIEKLTGSYNLKVLTCIKPADLYLHHKFTMINIVSLGDIMTNHRRTSYPLTQEWQDLATFIADRIKIEIENYFSKYDSFDKIISNRKDIEPKNSGLDNKYELLIYAAIRTKNKTLLDFYIDKKLSRPVMQISKSEYLKPENRQIDEVEFLSKIKKLAYENDFDGIEALITNIV
ncbi:hypothetical protein ACFP1I_13210 [Dyadobacter subterraneus]|uniref:Uncharacterized protein n=1 Tax=Dyadobacter subterraneus TaxID=2773304 RepID=A0ABR9W9N6_9BACT|nr:hypothetical protein [Dyadobacter subterraneus]MBE9462191.1 hypothetical protein [Dyadobacter subterraneus]